MSVRHPSEDEIDYEHGKCRECQGPLDEDGDCEQCLRDYHADERASEARDER